MKKRKKKKNWEKAKENVIKRHHTVLELTANIYITF